MKNLLAAFLTLASVTAFASNGIDTDHLVSGPLSVKIESSGKYLDLQIEKDESCKKAVKIRIPNNKKNELSFSYVLFQELELIDSRHPLLKRNEYMQVRILKDQAISLAMLPLKGQFNSQIEISACDEVVKVQTSHNYIVIKH